MFRSVDPADIEPLLKSYPYAVWPEVARLQRDSESELSRDEALTRATPSRLKMMSWKWRGTEAPDAFSSSVGVYVSETWSSAIAKAPYWNRVTHLKVTERSLKLLADVDLSRIRSLSIRDVEKKPPKLPPLRLPNLREIHCNGALRSLERMLDEFAVEDQLETLALLGGFHKANTFAFDPARLPSLRHFEFETMSTAKRLRPLLETASFERLDSLNLNGNKLDSKISRLAALRPGVEGLDTLRIGGADMKSTAVRCWAKCRFERLRTLDVSVYATGVNPEVASDALEALTTARSDNPLQNLIVRLPWRVEAARRFVAKQPFRKLARLYVRTLLTSEAPHFLSLSEVLSSPQFVRDPQQGRETKVLECLAALEPLQEAGVKVFVIR